jgi:aminoglycoside 3-N-acetyltransferase
MMKGGKIVAVNSNKIYTKADIISQLSGMKAPKNSIVLMHSSLRLVGNVEGGAKTLLDAMIEYFTEEGGLFCVPTHTWNNLDKEITLDMNDAKTCLGAFSDLAPADGRGIRSQNPSHSMMVFGDRERALDFIKDEPYVSSWTAPEGCYGKIYREGGYILLVGVAHNKNTYLHCVDEMLGVPNRLTEETYELTVKLRSGELVKRQMKAFDTDYTSDISLRFPKYETAFRYHGAICDGYVGNAPTQLCDARIMKETVELIMKNSNGNDPLESEKPIPPKLYC